MIRFQTLGTVDLRDAEQRELRPVVRRPKLLALLAYLAIARPVGFHRRDSLVALLWPELDHAHARNALRQALHALREALGRDVFLVRGEDELAVNERALWCDVREFERALDAGHAERSLELHRGALLRGLHLSDVPAFERWLDDEQEHVRQRACDAVRLLTDNEEAAGNTTGAARWARRLTELSPSDEKAVRRLIGILDRAGDRAGAVRAYEEFGRRLARDLELEPSSKTQGLVHSIRSRRQPERAPVHAPACEHVIEPDARIDLPAAGSPGVVAGRVALRTNVGRDAERTALRAAFEAASARQSFMLCVSGEPGIGKTTTVNEFLEDLAAAHAEHAVAKGRCSERLAGAEAYLPLLDALDSMLRVDSDGSVRRAVKAFAPSWYAEVADEVGGSNGAVRSPDASQERMKRELAAVIDEVCRLRPLVLFLDDVHWADASTVDVVGYLLTRLSAARLLVVATYRPSELQLARHPFHSLKLECQARGQCRDVPLAFLTRSDIARFLDGRFPDHRFPAALAQMIHDKTEGNPLFMVDLVGYLRERGVIRQEAGVWAVEAAVPDLQRDLPESVSSMVKRKVEQLAEGDRELLTACAVQGTEFDSAVVSASLGAEASDVEARLDKLDRVHGLVRRGDEVEPPNGGVTIRYRFVHVFYQNALYASLPPSTRIALSRSIAAALRDAHGSQPATVAAQLGFLFETGREYGRAAEYFQLAAQHAFSLFANGEAILLARRALGLLERLPASPERFGREIALQHMFATATMITSGFGNADAAAAMDRARTLAEQLGEHPHLGPVLYGLWAYYAVRGDLQQARSTAERLLAIGMAADDAMLQAAGHTAMGMTLQSVGSIRIGHRHLEQAATLHDPALRANALARFRLDFPTVARSGMVRTAWLLGFPDRALLLASHALESGRESGNPDGLGLAFVFAVLAHTLRREPAQALERAEIGLAFCEEHGIAQQRGWMSVTHGWAIAEVRDVGRGLGEMERAIQARREANQETSLPFCFALLAETQAKVGDLAGARRSVDEGLEISHRNHDVAFDAELFRLRGELQLAEGGKLDDRRRNAEASFRQAIDLARDQEARSLELRATTSLCRLLRDRGADDEGRSLLAGVLATFTEGHDTADLQTAKALLDALADPSRTRESSAERDVELHSVRREGGALPSIVVLPFANLSPDSDTDYFSDGLAEEVITDLSQVSSLRVISRTSAMKLKGFKEDLRTIGRQLNVRYVLEGSVRRAGRSLRITAKLVDASEDVLLWAEKFSGTLEDIFDIQDKVSRAIVSALRLKLAPDEERRIATRPFADIHAYECYQRARHEIWRAAPGGLDRALHLVRNGLTIVGENALLYAVMGQVHWQRAHTGVALDGSHLAEAERALEKVFAINPSSAHGHTLSAAIQYKKGRLQDVVRASKSALESEPNNAEALFWLTVMYAHAGRPSAARPMAEQLLHVDPLNAANYWARGWVEFTDGNFAEALRFSRRGRELDPDNFVCRCGHVVHLAGAGQTAEACREIDALPHTPEQPWSRAFIRYKAALQGNREEVLRDATPDVLSFAWDDEYASWQMAGTFAQIDQYEEALRWLEHATLERGFINYPFLTDRDPFLQRLRGDPRFDTLMEQVKQKWEAFEL